MSDAEEKVPTKVPLTRAAPAAARPIRASLMNDEARVTVVNYAILVACLLLVSIADRERFGVHATSNTHG